MFSTVLVVGTYLIVMWLLSKAKEESLWRGLGYLLPIFYWLAPYYMTMARPTWESYDFAFKVIIGITIFIGWIAGIILLMRGWDKRELEESPTFWELAESYEQTEREKWLADHKKQIDEMKALEQEEDERWLAEIRKQLDPTSEEDIELLMAVKSMIQGANDRKWWFVVHSQSMKHAESNSEKEFYKLTVEEKLKERKPKRKVKTRARTKEGKDTKK